jgi:hypothetical protein
LIARFDAKHDVGVGLQIRSWATGNDARHLRRSQKHSPIECGCAHISLNPIRVGKLRLASVF